MFGASSVSNAADVGIDVGRVDEVVDRLGARLRLGERVVGRREHDRVHLGLDGEDLALDVAYPCATSHAGNCRDRIAHRVRLALLRGPVHHLVVGQRVRVRADHVRVHERRSLPLARVVHRALHRRVAREQIAAVDFFHVQTGEGAHELRDRAARRVHLDGDRDRVAVVLDQVDDRQAEVRRRVQRLPELALRRRAVAGGDEHDLVVPGTRR